jgi:hypothetical protein
VFIPPVIKRIVPIAIVAALFAVPTAASAKFIELGGKAAPVAASCPVDCTALSKTTGYQGRADAVKDPFMITSTGKITAFTVQLGAPAADQIAFFQRLYGAKSTVRLSIFRQGKTKKTKRTLRLIRQSKVYTLNDYFGSAPTFAFDKPMPVTKGYVVAITSPTWAPIFATKQLGTTWWRASRSKLLDNKCKSITRNASAQKVGIVTPFGCDYFHVRLLYTATFVQDPVPTVKK